MSALEELYKLENFQEGKTDLDGFHKYILENNIWGFDAFTRATGRGEKNMVVYLDFNIKSEIDAIMEGQPLTLETESLEQSKNIENIWDGNGKGRNDL